MTSNRAREPAPLGTPEAFREFIGEMAAMARLQSGLIETYAEIGDDAGLSYAVRRLVAYTRQIVGTTADLRADQKRREAA